MGIVPLFATTCAAVYGRVNLAKRGLCRIHLVGYRDRRRQGFYLEPLFYTGHFNLESCTFTAGHGDSNTRKEPELQGKRVSELS